MGLFDGLGSDNSGILGGLPDWLFTNPQSMSGMQGTMAGGTPAGSFADRWGPVIGAINNGTFDPQGANFPGMYAAPFAGQMASAAPPGIGPGLTPPAPQESPKGSPAPYAPPGGPADIPPTAQPTGGQMPSALNGLPVPQMPSMPSFMGSAQAQTAPGAPGQPTPGIGDRLSAAGAGFFNAGSPMQAIGNLIGGAMTGQRQDPRGQQQQSQEAAEGAYKAAGIPAPVARAMALNPEVAKAVIPEYFSGWKIVKTGSNPITGDEYKMQGPGGQLRELGSFMQGGQGSEAGMPGGNGVMKPGVKYDANLPGEAYLEQFGPEMQAAAKAYLNGDAIPVGNPRLQGIAAAARTVAATYAMKMGIPFNESDYPQKRQMQLDLSKSSPNSIGGILSNGKSAFGHLANLSDKFVDLGNANGGGDYPGSAHIGAIGNYAGNVIAPSATTKGKLTAVNDNALKYGQEATKFYAGSGGGEAERMNALKTAKAETSTGIEQAAFLETEKQLMLERFHQKETQVRDRLGQKYLDEHPIMTPELEATIKKIDANIARLRGDKGAAPAPTSSAPAPLAGFKVLKVQ